MQPLKLNELAKVLGVSRACVDAHRKDGLPGIGAGRELRVDPQAAAEWYAHRGLNQYALKLCEQAREDKAREPEAVSPVQPDNDLDAMLSRAREAELLSWQAYEKNKSNVVMNQGLLEAHGQAADRRRKIEKDIAAIRLSQANAIPRAEAEQLLSRLAQEMRTNLMALPAALAGRCEMRKAGEIHKIIHDAMETALRALARGETK